MGPITSRGNTERLLTILENRCDTEARATPDEPTPRSYEEGVTRHGDVRPHDGRLVGLERETTEPWMEPSALDRHDVAGEFAAVNRGMTRQASAVLSHRRAGGG
jgi:hypothetical protein